MNAIEFKKAFAIAKSGKSLAHINIDCMFGFGLKDFQPVTCTLEQIAYLMKWQALQFNGVWLSEELEIIRQAGKKKFIIIDGEYTVIDGIYTPEQISGIRVAARIIQANN